jgi:carboxypeptidase family protein
VTAHAAKCETCKTLGQALDDPSLGGLTSEARDRILGRVRAEVSREQTERRGRLWRWAAGAMIVGGVSVGSLLIWQSRRSADDAASRGSSPGVRSIVPGSAPEDRAPALSGTSRLSGRVTDAAGEPVAGATVAEFVVDSSGDQAVLSPTPYKGTTDAAGKYSVSGVPRPRSPRLILRAFKLGHFSAAGGVRISPEMVADFRLTRWTQIAIDDVVKGTLNPGDTKCSGVSEPCQQFAVSVPRSGVLEVSISTQQKMDLWVELPNGQLHSPRIGAPRRVTVSVFAGSTSQISVVNYDTGPAQFELTMRLR